MSPSNCSHHVDFLQVFQCSEAGNMEENFTSAEKKGVVAAASKAWQKIADTLNKWSDVDKKSMAEHYRVIDGPCLARSPGSSKESTKKAKGKEV